MIKDKIQNKLLQYLWEDVESASYGNTARLFSNEITNYSDLYRSFVSDNQVFSDMFLSYYEIIELPTGVL